MEKLSLLLAPLFGCGPLAAQGALEPEDAAPNTGEEEIGAPPAAAAEEPAAAAAVDREPPAVPSVDPRGLVDASPGQLDSGAVSRLDALIHGRCDASLVELNLKKAGMAAVPAQIGQLVHLTKLEISLNPLDALPVELGALRQLRTLFCLGNKFKAIPEVLGTLPSLYMLSFKSNQLEHISESALSPSLHWLILTDNRLTSLPASIGKLSNLRKCMLTNNRLASLPNEIVDCTSLELIRLADNKLTSLPPGFLALPKLSWLALAGNPLVDDSSGLPPPRWLDPSELEIGEQLGAGGGGFVHRAVWRQAEPLSVAVKLFRDAASVTDGDPMHEIDVGAALDHPNVIRVLGALPKPHAGLVLELLELQPPQQPGSTPLGWSELGKPPSFDTCTRDTYPEDKRWPLSFVLATLRGIASACAHLHRHAFTHGDLYAHNTMVQTDGVPKLGDFGAAFNYKALGDAAAPLVERIEARAFGCLAEELLERLEATGDEAVVTLHQLKDSCLMDEVLQRPSFVQICERLELQEGIPPSSVQEGVPPSSAQEGIPPSAAQEGIPPSSLQEGIPPSAAQEGVPPSSDQEGIPPSSVQEGIPPSSDQEGIPPSSDQEGIPPSSVQEGVPPSTDQEGVPPSTDQEGVPPSSVQEGVPPSSVKEGVPPSSVQEDVPPSSVKEGVLKSSASPHIIDDESDEEVEMC